MIAVVVFVWGLAVSACGAVLLVHGDARGLVCLGFGTTWLILCIIYEEIRNLIKGEKK